MSGEQTSRFCGNCGKQIQSGDRFCRSCGTPAETAADAAATETWPAEAGRAVQPGVAATAAQRAAVTSVQPSVPLTSAPAKKRPRWLIPVLAGAALLLGVVAILTITLGSGSDAKRLVFAEQVAPVLHPVNTSAALLARSLRNADKPVDLAAVAADAEVLAQEIRTASGAADVLQVESEDAPRLESVQKALEATSYYAEGVIAAARNPTVANAKAAETGADSARSGWVAVATQNPDLSIPTEQPFNLASNLTTVAETKQQQQQAQASGKAAARSYVEKIDRLLTTSAETRGDLGGLIGDVQRGTISSSEARARIAAIINQRQGLQSAVASIDSPAQFRRSSGLLRTSITAALDDDFAIQGWINAWYDNDPYSFDRFFGEHEQATTRATAAKQAFVSEYNRARAQTLKLGPAPSGDRY